jgi:hypothetical protein
MLSVNCLYQMNPEKRKGEFEKGGRLPDWSGSGPWISDWALVAGIGRMYRVWPVSLAPPGLDDFSPTHPRLAPWAAFFRSFGAAAFSIPDLKRSFAFRDVYHCVRTLVFCRIDIVPAFPSSHDEAGPKYLKMVPGINAAAKRRKSAAHAARRG